MQDIEPLPSKRPNLSPEPSSSNPGGTFARTTSSGSYREASAVSPELQSQLESIGMRTRFNVNRGYARPFFPLQQVEVQSQSQAQRFQTEREVFQGVLGTKEKWGRTKSAPMRNFASFPDSAGETMDGELDLKRAREDVFAEFMEEEDDDDQDMTESSSSHGSKPIKSLPQRAPGSGTAFNTTMTLPASSDLASYLAHGQAQGRPEEATQDENWRAVDFSSFAKQHDF